MSLSTQANTQHGTGLPVQFPLPVDPFHSPQVHSRRSLEAHRNIRSTQSSRYTTPQDRQSATTTQPKEKSLQMKRPTANVTSPHQEDDFTGNIPLSIPSMIERHKGLMTAKQLAAMIGMPLPTLYQFSAQGRIPSFNVGGLIKFDPKTIAAWLRDRARAKIHQPRRAKAA
jgi:predicted DNA-binding transcriptional regulator AlpA